MAESGQSFTDAKLVYYFRIRRDKVEYSFIVDDGNQTDNISALLSGRAPLVSPPPYVVGVVTELTSQPEVPKCFRFTLQYVATGVRARQMGSVALSYDVVFSGNRALRSATFDVVSERLDDPRGFFNGQVRPIFSALNSKMEDTIETIPRPFLCAGLIEHDVTILSYRRSEEDEDEIILTANCDMKFRRSPYGEYASAYLLPRFPEPGQTKVSPVVLAYHDLRLKGPHVAGRAFSNVVRQNLEALELAMSAPKPKVVFVQGEPGSGKEGFAKAIHYGSRMDLVDAKPAPFSPRSIAGMSLKQFRREVLGEEKDGIVLPGLIESTREGTVFLDEFDKVGDDATSAYTELLRVWEAQEFVPENGRAVKKTGDLNWVVAGAFTSTRSTFDLPQDIWSRFSTQISLQNPISSPFVTESDQSKYIHGLVLCFVLGRAMAKVGDSACMHSVSALCDNKTRLHKVAADVLLGENRAQDDRLEPSPLIALMAIALGKYIGKYWSLSLELKRLPGEAPKFDTFCIPRTKQPAESARLTRIISGNALHHASTRYLHPLKMRKVGQYYDGVRSVRQASNVVFDRLFELFLQRSRSKIPAHPDQIEKILNEAFTTIDLARRGDGLERLVDEETLRALRFGLRGVVSRELIGLMAAEIEKV
jgi:hypothetical protein